MATYKNAKRKAKARELFQQGKTITEIINILRAKKDTVRNWVKDLPEYESRKFQRMDKNVLSRQRVEVLQVFRSGQSNKAAISRTTGASIANVRYWINKAFPVFDPKAKQKKAAIELHLNGRYTDVQIGALLGVRCRVVGQWIRESGIRNGAKTSRKREIVQRMFKGERFTMLEIMTIIGCNEQTVRRYIEEMTAKA